ncbi:hypothetical protein ACRAWF_39085 [Streptomyces sp. L7]
MRARWSRGPGGAVPVPRSSWSWVCVALAVATGIRPELAVWLLLAPVALLPAVTELALPATGVALALLGVVTFLPEHAGHWTTALRGALALGAAYYALSRLDSGGGGLGAGEVKLAGRGGGRARVVRVADADAGRVRGVRAQGVLRGCPRPETAGRRPFRTVSARRCLPRAAGRGVHGLRSGCDMCWRRLARSVHNP